MNIEDLELGLPNGLHDALLRAYSSDVATRRAELILDIWVGDLHSSLESERERHRPAKLELLGLAYFIVDVTDPQAHVAGAPVQIDACSADDNADLARQVPAGGFAGRFFVTEWNAFIHFAAVDARLTWLEVN